MIVAACVLMAVWGYGVWYENFGPGLAKCIADSKAERAQCAAEGTQYDGNFRRAGLR